MPYATIDDVKQRLRTVDALLAILDADAIDSAQETEVTRALEDASSVVDSHLARMLPLPETPPPWVRKATVDLAIYDLADGRVTEEHLRTRRDDAMDQLKAVGKAKAGLGADRTASSREGEFAVESEPQVFGRERSAGIL
ncbi:MAG: DUF1320 domain-containing protein [Myxococcota bacterium]